MEYKIFKILRHSIKIPFFVRLFFGVILILISSIPIVLPLFPGSLFLGIFILVVGFMLIVPGEKIRHVIKIRKGIFYLVQNFHRKRIIEHKMRDIRSHINDILEKKKDYFS